MYTYFNCGKAKEKVMLRVHELDKEMSGEDRFHLENISFQNEKYRTVMVPVMATGKSSIQTEQ